VGDTASPQFALQARQRAAWTLRADGTQTAPRPAAARANPPVPTPWFEPADAAAYLRLTVRGLEDMRGKSTGPRYHKVNARVIRYHRDDLDAWLLSDGGACG